MRLIVIACLVPLGAAAPQWTPDRGDGSYRNPVLHADYSDPDVVRVGADYFLTSSSFNAAPGEIGETFAARAGHADVDWFRVGAP